MITDIILTLFLVFLNGFFVAAEFAIVKVRLSQIEIRLRSGSFLAKIAKNIVEHLDAYLSATQLGITLASLALGWIGESVVADLVIAGMSSIGYTPDPELAHSIALPIAFIIITFLHIVLGELAPKSLAIQRSEAVALGVSIPLKAFYFLFRPFIWVLNSVANLLLSLIGIESAKEQDLHSAEELRYLFEESSKSGMIEMNEQEMIENVFVFQETTASEIMIPRGKIIGLEISMDRDSIVETVIEQGYSRMPVYQETLDNIVGIVYAKDILTMMSFSDLIILQDIVRPVTFIQELDKIHSLLTKMQKQKFHMAVVLDEFGGTSGLVTLEDIMEELVGDIQDEYDEEKPIVESKSPEEWTISADASIADVNEFLPYPFPESDEYQTVGGMINHISGRIPGRYSRVNLPPFYICLIDQSNSRKVESVTLKIDKDRLYATKD
jgi:CBS domain containing-hemolysin-like protein